MRALEMYYQCDGSTPREPIRGKRVLVVEDEPWVAAVLVEILRVDGHEVDMADNGWAALGKIREESYDLILSDMAMPELDGPSLYGILQSRRPELLRRVAFVTGQAERPGYEEFLERTGAPYLPKPFTIEDLHEFTQRVLRTA